MNPDSKKYGTLDRDGNRWWFEETPENDRIGDVRASFIGIKIPGLVNVRPHREDGPALIAKNGDVKWFRHGQICREDGPALIRRDGTREWFEEGGRHHREDGPAIEKVNGEKRWYIHGRLHREDGPAVEFPDGRHEPDPYRRDFENARWFLDGKAMFEPVYAQRNPEGYRRWVERRVAEDPTFVTSNSFRKWAPRDLKDKYPEAGADFGFFDAKANEAKHADDHRAMRGSDGKIVHRWVSNKTWWGFGGKEHPPARWADGSTIERVSGMVRIGDVLWFDERGLFHRSDGPAIEKKDGSVLWAKDGKLHRKGGPAIEHANGTREWYVNGRLHRVGGPAIVRSDGRAFWYRDGVPFYDPPAHEYDSYFRGRIAKDPTFVTSEFFRKNASPKLKAEYPEAGADFGFFDARRTNESADETRVEVGDWVMFSPRNGRPSGPFSKTRLSGEAYVESVNDNGTFTLMLCDRRNGKLSYPGMRYKNMVIPEPIEIVEKCEDHIRRNYNNPDLMVSYYFREVVPDEVKRRVPEAGFDFGFFDAKKESLSALPKRINRDMKKVLSYIELSESRRVITGAMHLPPDVERIAAIFEAAGKKLYVVGGAVRDHVMGKFPHDYDLVTDALPEEVIGMFRNRRGYNAHIDGRSFAVVRIGTPEFPAGYEIATFRKDLSKGRDTKSPGEKVEVGHHITIEDDVRRRDLSINSLFYDIRSKRIVDLVGGLRDIENEIIRAVGDPHERFQEDRLRILRTIRFSATLDATIDPATAEAIEEDNRLRGVSPVDDVSQSRINEEFDKVIRFADEHDDLEAYNRYLGLISEFDMWEQMFPGLKVDDEAVPTVTPVIMYAVLFGPNHHATVRDDLVGLRFSNAMAAKIAFLIRFADNLSPENAYELYREKTDVRVTDDDIREYGEVVDLDKDLVDTFLRYRPTVSGNDVVRDGFRGENIRIEIQRREAESFRRITNPNYVPEERDENNENG